MVYAVVSESMNEMVTLIDSMMTLYQQEVCIFSISLLQSFPLVNMLLFQTYYHPTFSMISVDWLGIRSRPQCLLVKNVITDGEWYSEYLWYYSHRHALSRTCFRKFKPFFSLWISLFIGISRSFLFLVWTSFWKSSQDRYVICNLLFIIIILLL